MFHMYTATYQRPHVCVFEIRRKHRFEIPHVHRGGQHAADDFEVHVRVSAIRSLSAAVRPFIGLLRLVVGQLGGQLKKVALDFACLRDYTLLRECIPKET